MSRAKLFINGQQLDVREVKLRFEIPARWRSAPAPVTGTYVIEVELDARARHKLRRLAMTLDEIAKQMTGAGVSDRLAQLKADWGRALWDKYIRTENDERAALAGYTVDERLGQHVCDFFRRFLRLSKGEWVGRPFELAEYQQRCIVIPLFSWIRPDGRRRFTQAEIWLAKKHGKSAISSGFSVYGLRADGEPGAEIYNLANDRAQAAIVFGESANMVEASPELRKELEVIRSAKRITWGTTAWIAALSAEHATAEGKNAHMWIIDEIHAFNERGRLLREAMRYAGAARRQPLEIVISTAGDDYGPGRDEYDFAKDVQKGQSAGGITDLHTFVFIAEADPKDDPGDPATWRKANPGIGVTLKEEDLANDYAKARSKPRLMASFKRYRLNLWTGSETPWLDVEKWKQSATALDLAALSLRKAVGCGGLDLSDTTDLSAWAMVFKKPLPAESPKAKGEMPKAEEKPPEDEASRPPPCILVVKVRLWLPEEGIEERERNDRAPYRQWAEEGWLTLCPGAEVDETLIEEQIAEDCATYGLVEFGYDPWQAKHLRQSLEKKKGFRTQQVEVPQTFAGMTYGSKKWEAALKAGRVEHDGNPIMARMVDQVRCISDTNGNIRPVKRDRAKRRVRIDGVVATIIAVGRVLVCKQRRGGSFGLVKIGGRA